MRSGTVVNWVGVTALMVVAGLAYRGGPPLVAEPQIVHVTAGSFTYRPAGEFRQGTRIVDAPEITLEAVFALDVMKFPVSEADYTRCVAENACADVSQGRSTNYPQTHVNHDDATAYANWLSERSGTHWRLPTDAEWLRVAADRAQFAELSSRANGADPSRRWLESYRSEVGLRGDADAVVHPLGSFGENALGVADIAGNVWEWTDTCFQNGTVTADGTGIDTSSDYCGVRAVQGRHRAFVIEFIRDARSGGCGAGIPPDYLGFRLVRAPG